MILPTKEEGSRFPAIKEQICQGRPFLVFKSFLNAIRHSHLLVAGVYRKGSFEKESRAAALQASTVLENIHQALSDEPRLDHPPSCGKKGGAHKNVPAGKALRCVSQPKLARMQNTGIPMRLALWPRK